MVDVIVSGTHVSEVNPNPIPTKAFRLLPEKAHSHNNVSLEPGDVVYLNQNQAEAFKDKFVAVDDGPWKVRSAEEMAKFAEDAANVRAQRAADAKK